MPRTGAPPMIGDTPTTVFARIASAIPGTARIVPMLTTGLDGGSTTTSASASASSTPGAGEACAAPAKSKPAAGTPAPIRTHHSWKCTVRPASSPSSTTWVSTRSSDIGSSVTPGCHRWHSTAVTADSGSPAASMLVRCRCVAMSASPRLNEFGQDVVGVPGPAPALFLVDATAEGVHHGVKVGGHVQAEKGDVVAGVAYDGDLGIGSFGYEPAQEAGTPDATRGHGDAHGGKSGNRGLALSAHPPGSDGAKPVTPRFWPGLITSSSANSHQYHGSRLT